MRTFSHLLMTAAIAKRVKFERSALLASLIGSIAPDIPLFVLTTFTMLTSPSNAIGMERMHANYTSNPLWIVLHNTPHSLIIIGGIALVAFLTRRKPWIDFLLWFAAGATFHICVDIFTHAGDGPLFLFPLSWSLRFNSPLSYWDHAHYGGVFTVLEYSFDVLITLYLGFGYWHYKNRASHSQRVK